MRFGGKVAIVTGGASGIGAAFARRVQADGFGPDQYIQRRTFGQGGGTDSA